MLISCCQLALVPLSFIMEASCVQDILDCRVGKDHRVNSQKNSTFFWSCECHVICVHPASLQLYALYEL